MPTIQKTYTRKSAVAFPGMIADIDSANRVVSRVAEGAIGFGKAVFMGTNKESQVKPAGVIGTGGYIVDTTTYAVTDQTGKTQEVSVDNGPTQTMTFGTATTNAHIAAAWNAQIKGIVAAVVGGQVKVSSLSTGKNSSVRIVGGTSALTYAAAVQGTDANFVGVAVREHVNPEAYLGQYADEWGGAGIITEGGVWVEFEDVATPGATVTVDITTGLFGISPADATHAPINGELDTNVTAQGQMAILDLGRNK